MAEIAPEPGAGAERCSTSTPKAPKTYSMRSRERPATTAANPSPASCKWAKTSMGRRFTTFRSCSTSRRRAWRRFGIFYRGGVLDAGSGPSGAVVELGGVLYGTTAQGGGKGCPMEVSFDKGCGTVFSFTAKAGETILYSFRGEATGRARRANWSRWNGVLYGVTPGGGGASGCNYIYSSGCGTIYSVTTSGKEKVLHVFGAAAGDGKQPMAGLTNVDGVLYGTTSQGGRYGFGTVFEITP